MDDASFARQVLEQALFPELNADVTISRALGETQEEQFAFVDYALGRVDSKLQPLAPPHRQADVAVLDHHILLGNEPHVLGADLVTQLREQGFTGVTCILSGVSNEGVTELAALPGVD
eukprot:6871175-Prymnesium_polylepis.1